MIRLIVQAMMKEEDEQVYDEKKFKNSRDQIQAENVTRFA